MRYHFVIAAVTSFMLLTTTMCVDLPAQTVPLADQSKSPPDFQTLTDKVVEIIFKDGHSEWPLKIAKVESGSTAESLKSMHVQFKDEKRLRKIPATKISEIILDHEPLDMEYDRKARGLVHSPEKREKRVQHQATVEKRLKSQRRRLWPPLTEKKEADFLADQQQLIKKTQAKFPNINFRVVETGFFFVCTDLSSAQVDGYLASLDAMYRELCKAFGLPPNRKIWCGKCVVFAFSREADFRAFEAAIMNNSDTGGAQGLCHSSSNGRVVFAGYRGNSDSYFGSVMVHETAHGFVHRYLSSARAPSWLNEGMSDWVANAIMKTGAVARKQIKSANVIRQAGTWGDFLTTDRIEFDFYGAASTLVEILLRRDKGGQFREFFRGIKEGEGAEESLKQTFGLSYQDLQILYAEQLRKIPTRMR